MRVFIDEMGHCLTEAMLRQEFELLKLEHPEEYNYTFEEYIKNCLDKNGTLTELYNGIWILLNNCFSSNVFRRVKVVKD